MYIKHTISEVIYYVIFLLPGLFLLTAIHNETEEHMCAPKNICVLLTTRVWLVNAHRVKMYTSKSSYRSGF